MQYPETLGSLAIHIELAAASGQRISDSRTDHTQSQFGPSAKCSFSVQNTSKFAVSPTPAPGPPKLCSKEVAPNETFPQFFRLNL